MNKNERVKGKYSVSYMQGEKIKELKKRSRGELKPWVKKAKRIIKRVVAISAVIIAVNYAYNGIKGYIEEERLRKVAYKFFSFVACAHGLAVKEELNTLCI